MWFPREISAHLEHLVATRPVVILTGARQTGKTSLLERALPSFGRIRSTNRVRQPIACADGPRC